MVGGMRDGLRADHQAMSGQSMQRVCDQVTSNQDLQRAYGAVAAAPATLSDVLKRTVAMRDYAQQVAEDARAVRRRLCEHSGPSASVKDLQGSAEKSQSSSQGLINDIMAQLDELRSALDAVAADTVATAARLG